MPYNADPYRGDKYISQINLPEQIDKAFERYSQHKKELAKADSAMFDMSRRIDPATGEPMLDPEVYERWRQTKDRASAYAGVKEAMGLAKQFSEVQAGNEERERDAAAFEQPVFRVGNRLFGRHTRGASVNELDPPSGGAGRGLTPNALLEQYNRDEKAQLAILKNYPLTTGLDENPDKLLDETNPFGVVNPKTDKFEATPKGSQQTHVMVGDNRLPIEEYKKLQKTAQYIRDLRQKRQNLADSGGLTSAPSGGRRPLTKGVPVVRSQAELDALPPTVTRVQTPSGRVFRRRQGGVLPAAPAPYNPGAEVKKASLVPSPDEE